MDKLFDFTGEPTKGRDGIWRVLQVDDYGRVAFRRLLMKDLGPGLRMGDFALGPAPDMPSRLCE